MPIKPCHVCVLVAALGCGPRPDVADPRLTAAAVRAAAAVPRTYKLENGVYRKTVVWEDGGVDEYLSLLLREGDSVGVFSWHQPFPGPGRLEGNRFTLDARSSQYKNHIEGRLVADDVLEVTRVMTRIRDGSTDRESFRLEKHDSPRYRFLQPPAAKRDDSAFHLSSGLYRRIYEFDPNSERDDDLLSAIFIAYRGKDVRLFTFGESLGAPAGLEGGFFKHRLKDNTWFAEYVGRLVGDNKIEGTADTMLPSFTSSKGHQSVMRRRRRTGTWRLELTGQALVDAVFEYWK